MNHYIFGYGSLICQNSRARTGNTGEGIPVIAKDISRSWSVPVPDISTTALGASQKSGALCNGVIFPVGSEALREFDIREKGYDRIQLEHTQFEDPRNIPADSTIWVYVGQQTHKPSTKHPIPQSYVDVILNGCFDYGREFTDSFIRTTTGWNHLLDDRHSPRYPRHIKNFQHAVLVDAILKSRLPHLYQTV